MAKKRTTKKRAAGKKTVAKKQKSDWSFEGKILVILFTVIVLALIFGMVKDGSANSVMGDMDHGDHAAMDHSHESIEVDDLEQIPSVELQVLKDAKSGYNLRILTENFAFVPELVNTDYVPNEGHAHIYVDGEKLARVYGEWYHLDGLKPGEYEIRVDLTAHNHASLVYQDEHVADTVLVTFE
jgi:hypothetical protein